MLDSCWGCDKNKTYCTIIIILYACTCAGRCGYSYYDLTAHVVAVLLHFLNGSGWLIFNGCGNYLVRCPRR